MPVHPKIAKLDTREQISMQELEANIKAARQRVAIIVHAAARDRKLVVSGRNREKLYKQIGDVYLQLDNGLKDWGKDLVNGTAIEWHDAAIKDITGQTGTDPSNAVTKFSREYAEDVFKRVHPENGRSLAAVVTDKMAAEDIKSLRQATVDVYRESALSGMTLNQIHAGIQDRWDTIAGDQAAFRFVDQSGRKWDNARYLQMLVRTTTARVARDSYFDTLTQNGDDLAIVQNVDGEACEICAAWDGVIISITGTSDKYPSYQQALDAGCFHPNCRCVAERVDETVDKTDIKRQAETPTPDFSRGDTETDSEYRNRMTEQVHAYNDQFSADASGVDPEVVADQKKAEAAAKATPPPEPSQIQKMVMTLQADMAAVGYSPQIVEAVKDIPDQTWEILNKSSGKAVTVTKAHTVNSKGQIGACYHPYRREIELKMDPKEWSGHPTTLHHEVGHDAHYETRAITDVSFNKDLQAAMQADIKAFIKQQKTELGNEGFINRFSPNRAYFGGHAWRSAEGIASDLTGEHRVSGLMDTVGGLTKGSYGAGHSKTYYRRMNNGAMEAYANIFRGIVNKWGEYDKFFPLTTAWIRSSLKL
jgi:hypothetical protein